MRRQQGYTLIEMMITLTIIVVLLAIGTAYFNTSRANNELRTSSRLFEVDLQYARQVAKTEGSSTVATTTAGYTVQDANAATVKAVTLPASVTLTIPGGMGSFTFAANGVPSAGGSYTLTSTVTNRTVTVTVNQATGIVTLVYN